MKPFRITVVLLALLVLPLFASQAMAQTYFNCPSGIYEYHEDGGPHYTAYFDAFGDGTNITAITVAGPAGMTLGLDNVTGLGTDHVTGRVSITVDDHCQTPGGLVTLTGWFILNPFLSCNFNVTLVNNDPYFTTYPTGIHTFDWNVPYSFDADATDDDASDIPTLQYSLPTSPSGMNINVNTGVISWTPNCDDVGGPYDVMVRVTDICSAFEDRPYQVIVTNPATFTGPPNEPSRNTNDNYATGNFDVYSGDAGINIVDVSVTSVLPGGISVMTVIDHAPNYGFPTLEGHVIYTVSDHCQTGTFDIELTATDDCSTPNTFTSTFQITLGNDPPDFTTHPPDVQDDWNQLFVTTDFAVSDPNGDAVTVVISGWDGDPLNIPVIVGSHVQWQPTCQDVGYSYHLQLRVDEDPPCNLQGGHSDINFIVDNPATFTCPNNETQHINGLAYTTTTNWSANSGDPGINIVSVASIIADPPGITNIIVNVDPPGYGFPTATGTITYDVTDHCLAGGGIVLQAMDDCPTPNVIDCAFFVTLTNTDPYFTFCPGNASFAYTAGYTSQPTAADADGDNFTFSLYTFPAGMTINATTGVITWTTDCLDVGGPYTVVVQVTDVCNGFVRDCTFQLTVTNAPPVITQCPNDAVMAAGCLHVSSPFAGYDPEAQVPLTWSVQSVTPSPTTMPTIVGDHVEWQTALVERGVYTITVRLTDECGLFDECTYKVDVLFPFEFTCTSVETLGIDSSVVNGDYVNVLALAIRFHVDPTVLNEELNSIWINSWNDEHYAVNAIKLWRENGNAAGFQPTGVNMDDLVQTISNPGTFDDQERLQFFGLGVPMPAGTDQDFYFAYDMNPDINGDMSYNNLWLGIRINPDDIELDVAGLGPHGSTDTLTYPHRRIRIDVECPPIDSVFFALAEETGVDSIIHLGDSIWIYLYCSAGDLNFTQGVKADFSVFKAAPTTVTLTRATPLADSFYYGYRIKKETVAHPIDVDSAFYDQLFTARDTVGNICSTYIKVHYAIDTEKPLFDSVRVVLFYDANGDDEIAIGDSLQFFAWMENNALGEIESVWVAMDSAVGWPWEVALEDTANERKWQWKSAVGPGLIDTTANELACWFHAFDNSAQWGFPYYTANTDSMRFLIPYSIDVIPPTGATVLLQRWVDVDSNNVMNLGDTVLIEVNASNIPDMAPADSCPVEVLLLEAGFGGPDTCFSDNVGGVYTLLWELKPDPQDFAIDVGAYVAFVRVVIKDDQGNVDTVTSNTIDRPVDTTIPDAVSGLVATAKSGCVVELTWTGQAYDAYMFAVFMAKCEEAFDFDDTTGSSFNTTSKKWTTDGTVILEHGQCYKFVVLTKDDGGNWQLMSEMDTVAAWADCMPPHVCIVSPDSGGTYGNPFPIKALADSVSWDVKWAELWYKKLDTDGFGTPGPWTQCISAPKMYRPGNGLVFVDTVACIQDYTGWVWFAVKAGDSTGNTQDTSDFEADACIQDPLTEQLRHGYFMIYWDAGAPNVIVASVNGTGWPQSDCGFDVWTDSLNEVVITVEGADSTDSFEVEVRGPGNHTNYTIFHEDNLTMPCTIWVSVDGWSQGTRNLYVYVKDYDNENEGNLTIPLCVPPSPPEHCIYISEPVEWQRIPCTGISGQNCVAIAAELYDYYQCRDVGFNEVVFQWSPNGIDSWEEIEEVIGSGGWTTCWDNTGLVDHGDTVYLRVIAHDEYFMADTSEMVKVFVDCEAPNVQLLMEPLYYTCGNLDIPKINCDPLTFKAVVLDTLVDITYVEVYVKLHSDPDIYAYWWSIADLDEPYYGNIWSYILEDPCEEVDPNDYWDFRIDVIDQAGHVMFDYDGDGKFDDSTFNTAVAFGAAMTVFVDEEAPEPAISMVADPAASIYNVNPSSLLGGSDKAYVQAGNDITVEISVLPSEDTCEVMKVEYSLRIGIGWVHVGISTHPYHFPITFNPLTGGLIPPDELEDGWWSGQLKAVLYDSLGNSESDQITLYILDITPTQAIIVEPENDSYVWGDVDLSVAALNAYEMCKVCYQYSQDGSVWLPINEGEENGCSTEGEDFPIVWHTLNTIADGVYYLRAVATDCDNNEDDDPPTIQVTVANELPSVTVSVPFADTCSRECPDNPVVTIGFVGGEEVLVQATVDSDIPVERVKFYYKDIFGSSWDYIGTDYFPTNQIYDVLWDTEDDPDEDGPYHVKAIVYNAAGRDKDSEPVEVFVDNTDPRVNIVSVNGETHPEGMDIALYDTLAIQVVAYDDDSDAGATRCYNSGVTMLGFCVTDGALLHDGEWPLSQLNWYTDFHDGDTLIYWNVSGLDIGTYYIYVLAKDCIGNWEWDEVEIRVYDHTPPLVTVGAFFYNPCTNQHFIYGYTCAEDLLWAKFEYRMIQGADTSAWLPTGEADWYSEHDGQSTKHCSSEDCECCYREFIQSVWDLSGSLVEGVQYQGRFLSTDYWGNNSEDYPETYAPIVNFTYQGGVIVPEPGPLSALFFEKNFDVGRMHGMVMQNVSEDGLTPQVFGVYLPDWGCGDSEIECVWMQEELENTNYFGGSFEAGKIWDGGIGVFFSSVTQAEDGLPPATGEEQLYTYIISGDIMVVKVDRDLGTFTTYWTEDSVGVYVPGGAVNEDRHLVVWPETMPPFSLEQPTWMPVGDDNGFATYVGFTTSFGNCFLSYAKIRMNYSETLNVPAESLIVAWWDAGAGEAGMWSTADLYWGSHYAEGFNTEEHYVEFLAKCLEGPFAVIHLLAPECEGSIVVKTQGIEPYCNGYTNSMPTFTTLITDNVQGPEVIVQSSIKFMLDLYESGELIPIYDGGSLADGFDAGYNTTSGIFKVGWDPCYPGDELEEGDHIATVGAQNDMLHSCTRTLNFKVDATPPDVVWYSSYVLGSKPAFKFTITDGESGVNKDAICIDIYDADESTQPYEKNLLLTICDDGLNEFWTDDNTLLVKLTDPCNGHYMHVVIYDGNYTTDCVENDYCVRVYDRGVMDCVGNKASYEHLVFPVDRVGPTCDLLTPSYEVPVKIKVVDWLDTLWYAIVDTFPYHQYKPGSGLDVNSIQITENGVEVTSFSFNSYTNILTYTPTISGPIAVEISMMDMMGNEGGIEFNTCDDDTVKPAMTLKTPSYASPVKIQVVEDGSGVDPTSIQVTENGESVTTYSYDVSTKILTYTPTVSGKLTVEVAISDNVGNTGWESFNNWDQDAEGPVIKLLSEPSARPMIFSITDTLAGVDWLTLVFDEDGNPVETVDLDTTAGTIEYTPPTSGLTVKISVSDNAGNASVETFTTEEEVLVLKHPHNYPNPFDPRNENTYIVVDPSKRAYVTVKIYDFAGEYVTTVGQANRTVSPGSDELIWNGTTDGGTRVATGTYLCHIKARDEDGAVATAVIKITVLKQDK